MQRIEWSKLRLTYIGLFFFVLSLLHLPMFYLILTIWDFIRFEMSFVSHIVESHPFFVAVFIFLLSIFGLITHVLFRAKKNKKASLVLSFVLFLILTLSATILTFNIFQYGFPNQPHEMNESYSSYWIYYLNKSINFAMWFYPVFGIFLDILFNVLKSRIGMCDKMNN